MMTLMALGLGEAEKVAAITTVRSPKPGPERGPESEEPLIRLEEDTHITVREEPSVTGFHFSLRGPKLGLIITVAPAGEPRDLEIYPRAAFPPLEKKNTATQFFPSLAHSGNK